MIQCHEKIFVSLNTDKGERSHLRETNLKLIKRSSESSVVFETVTNFVAILFQISAMRKFQLNNWEYVNVKESHVNFLKIILTENLLKVVYITENLESK